MNIQTQNIFTLNWSEDLEYNLGYFIIVSAEQTLSKIPIANGGAAVNNWKDRIPATADDWEK